VQLYNWSLLCAEDLSIFAEVKQFTLHGGSIEGTGKWPQGQAHTCSHPTMPEGSRIYGWGGPPTLSGPIPIFCPLPFSNLTFSSLPSHFLPSSPPPPVSGLLWRSGQQCLFVLSLGLQINRS